MDRKAAIFGAKMIRQEIVTATGGGGAEVSRANEIVETLEKGNCRCAEELKKIIALREATVRPQ